MRWVLVQIDILCVHRNDSTPAAGELGISSVAFLTLDQVQGF